MIKRFTKEAIKALEHMDAATRRRIGRGIQGIPAGDIKRLTGNTGVHRLRVGDWRILFSYADGGVYIKAILPRGGAYKKKER
jgi:mRNA interferase RelE/StbE